MKKPIAIIAGEPNSISSEIIFKSWSLKNKFLHKPFFVIGSIKLLTLQKKKLNYNFKFKKISDEFRINDLKGKELPIYDVKYEQKKPFKKISSESKEYILKCFDVAIKLTKNNKIIGLINCPVSKEHLFKKKHQGITEFLSKKTEKIGEETMLIYNKKLAVCPITTHIPLSQVHRKIKQDTIVKKV